MCTSPWPGSKTTPCRIYGRRTVVPTRTAAMFHTIFSEYELAERIRLRGGTRRAGAKQFHMHSPENLDGAQSRHNARKVKPLSPYWQLR
jgi:hypothetical protein